MLCCVVLFGCPYIDPEYTLAMQNYTLGMCCVGEDCPAFREDKIKVEMYLFAFVTEKQNGLLILAQLGSMSGFSLCFFIPFFCFLISLSLWGSFQRPKAYSSQLSHPQKTDFCPSISQTSHFLSLGTWC